jgi:putative hemolysin
MNPLESWREEQRSSFLYRACARAEDGTVRAELFRRLGPALELGRSFVRSEHQRSFSALLLLWRGIGEFVVRQPRYRFLFGPVSISADYQRLSRALMARFLIDHLRDPELARLVRPRRPFRALRHHRRAVTPPADLDEISSLIAHLEADQKGIPVLLRQYLKLGARVLGLNLDPDFSEVLDALVLVDLCRTAPRVLERYLGHAGARSFLAHHRGRDGVGTAPAGRQ